MSSLSHTGQYISGVCVSNLAEKLKKTMAGFFRSKKITQTAKIYHGDFSYDLIPNTSINSFANMSNVTAIDTGDLHICVFEEPNYQGQYQILNQREKVIISNCGSVVISMQPVPVEMFRSNPRPPVWCWEMSAQKYLWHFFQNYRYV